MTSQKQSIVITGASAGIGEATAILFARNGWRVVMGARRTERLENIALNLAKEGFKDLYALDLDVTSDPSVTSFCRETRKILGNAGDVLFNNAGMALGVDRVATGNMYDWQTMLDVNVSGLLRVTREFLPHMISANNGHVINMGSIAGQVVYEGGSVYCATKHAVRAITKTLRLELNGTAIRVTSIDPGMVETEFSNVRFGDLDKAKAVYKGLKPLSAHDIAECVLWSAARPRHVNIEEITVMPVAQAAPHKVHRDVSP